MFLRFKREVLKMLNVDERFVKESDHADLACTIAFKLAKEQKRSPQEVAEEIVAELEPREYIGSIEVVNGYINFFVSEEFLEDTVNLILDQDYGYGSPKIKGEVLVEHTSANPDGPLHIGHIRNSIIGDTLTRIMKKAGLNVKTQYYVNDMGRQIAITALGYKRFGIDRSKKSDHAIVEAYIKMNRELEENPELEKEVEFKEEDLERFLRGKFTLKDMYAQLEAMRKMGPLKQILRMIPGLGYSLPDEVISVGEERLRKFKVIMDSMTEEELLNPKILDSSRIKRIAIGSGTSPQDVKELLKYYNTMKNVMKKIKKGKLPIKGFPKFGI